jgi:hypothetical protein
MRGGVVGIQSGPATFALMVGAVRIVIDVYDPLDRDSLGLLIDSLCSLQSDTSRSLTD